MDPLAAMRVTENGFRDLAARSAELGPRVAAVLEGGYDPRTLPNLLGAARDGFSKRRGRPFWSRPCRRGSTEPPRFLKHPLEDGVWSEYRSGRARRWVILQAARAEL